MLVTVVIVLTLLAMYGVYNGMAAWIAGNKEDRCLTQAISADVRRMLSRGLITYQETSAVEHNLSSYSRDIKLAMYEHCKRQR